MNTSNQKSDHYDNPNLISRIESDLQKLGKSSKNVSINDLATVDEFHLRGSMATKSIIELLQARVDSHLVDLGSGLGGPARRFAESVDCWVTGVDLSQDYCKVANELSRWVGLNHKTNFVHGNVTNLEGHISASYDGAYSIHVGMNIQDRDAFYREAFRVLKSKSHFVLYDIVPSQKNTAVKYPQPWALKASDSFLLTEQQMIAELEQAGFFIESVLDDTSLAIEFLQSNITKAQQFDGPLPMSLATVLGPVVTQIFPNLVENLAKKRLRLIAVSATKNQ